MIKTYDSKNIEEFMQKIKNRNYEKTEIKTKVEKIINDVKTGKDQSLIYYTKKFDDIFLEKKNIKVSEQEIKEAYHTLNKKQIKAIKTASERIRRYAEKQLDK
ncbi:histidinol dehydrogenase, partial [Candidatus Woesearchaeota archaeon]|nr:histidinol dehydrogenase [Candidatus Woesearchaeota archaeon]